MSNLLHFTFGKFLQVYGLPIMKFFTHVRIVSYRNAVSKYF